MIWRRLDLRRFVVIGSVIIGVAFGLAALASADGPIAAENAWVPWAPAAVKVHAGYMTLVNRGNAEQHIVGADSPNYARVELHRSSVKDGMSQMRTVDQVAVPANGRVAFEPSGLHFMLIGPKRTHAVDDRVRIVLRLRDGAQIDVSAVVRKRGGASHDHHRHHGAAR